MFFYKFISNFIKICLILSICIFIGYIFQEKYQYNLFSNINCCFYYINLCKKMRKIYQYSEKSNNIPFFSICIPVYNMENYIEISILSILNQSFRDFEIVIINDHSIDDSEQIIKRLQHENSKIRVITHEENLGIYKSRVDSIQNAKGQYIIFLDPDDILSEHNLLKYLYDFQLSNHLDIIEYSVLIQEEIRNIIYYPLNHRRNHFHSFGKTIIYHPELSNILFFENNYYSDIICRCLWNKMVRKNILIKTINFLGNKTYQIEHFDFAEDTIINILNFEFASNYSNINLHGYMYNIRKDSMSHSNNQDYMNLKMGRNMLYFYRLFYNYIKYFNKDFEYLFHDLKSFDYFFNYFKNFSSDSDIKQSIVCFYNNIIDEKNISSEFRKYANEFIQSFDNSTS